MVEITRFLLVQSGPRAVRRTVQALGEREANGAPLVNCEDERASFARSLARTEIVIVLDHLEAVVARHAAEFRDIDELSAPRSARVCKQLARKAVSDAISSLPSGKPRPVHLSV